MNELNLVENTQNETTATIITTNLPTEEQQREYSTVIKSDKKEANKNYDMMQLDGTVIYHNTQIKA